MASYFNPMSALSSSYGASSYARPSLGGYQSSLSGLGDASPYGIDAYGANPYAADQDPIAALMSMLAPPPPPPPPQPAQYETVVLTLVLGIIKMLLGQQGKESDCKPCQKKQQQSNDYGPRPYAPNPSYAPSNSSQYNDEPDYQSVLNNDSNPYQDTSVDPATTYIPPDNSGEETELVGDGVDNGDPFGGAEEF